MNRLRLCISTALCAASIAFASQTASGEVGRPSGQALQFTIRDFMMLTSFGGSTLSYQRFVSPDVAWRASVGIAIIYNQVERFAEYATEDLISDSIDCITQNNSVSAASEWLWYRGQRVSMFFGGGPRVSFSSYEYGDAYFSGGGERWRYHRTKSHTLGAGLQGCIGVQWAACNWLALHAQYGSEFEYVYTKWQRSNIQTGVYESFEQYTDTSNGVRVTPVSRFGVSAYF